MAGIFDFTTGAFDSSEAALLHQAYDIALQGLMATEQVDRSLRHRLARSIVKVARGEPDCLRNDGGIDPVKLAQRAILRMLQMNAPTPGGDRPAPNHIGTDAQVARTPGFRPRFRRRSPAPAPELRPVGPRSAESVAKVMMRLFERTPFAKL